MTSSFAPPPVGNRATLRLPEAKVERPVWLAYLFGLIAVCVLFLMGHSLLSLTFALVFPGVALCIRPPKNGLGKWFDYGVLGFLGCVAFAFLPQFYWPSADWRVQAVQDYGIDLPSVLSVHPWISLEVAMMVVAGICWFYAASGWTVNVRGRKYFFFALSFVIAAFAGLILWRNYYSVRSFMLGDAKSLGMLADQAQLGSILMLGGVVSFGYAVEGLRVRNIMHVSGLICSILCMIALVMNECLIGGVLYFLGVSLWYLVRVRSKALPLYFKVAYPVLVSTACVFLFVNDQVSERVAEGVGASAKRLLIYQDSVDLLLDAPILGNGVATFTSIFPQYRAHSRSAEVIQSAGSDALTVLTEVGLLGFVCLAILLFGYFKRCRGLSLGRGGSFRVIALVAVISFLLYSVIDVPGHRPAAIYLVLLLAAFALPGRAATCPTLKPVLWRVIGIVLILSGSVWGVASLTSAPFHSSTAIAHYEELALGHADAADYGSAIDSLDAALAWNPMLRRAYSQRAAFGLGLKRDITLVAEDFKRARMLEPTLGAFCVEEGFTWLPHYVDRAVMAWEQALSRELEDPDQAYVSMLKAGQADRRLMDAMLRLSRMNPHNRTLAFHYFDGPLFIKEIEQELLASPALEYFTSEQRFRIIQDWIQCGNLDTIESFLEAYGDSVAYGWWLKSLLMKERTDFVEAVDYVRTGVITPDLAAVDIEPDALTRMAREFSVTPDNVSKGTQLLSAYLQDGELSLALGVADAMLEAGNAPAYIHYWRGEILYQMEDIIESWYGYRNYVLQEYSLTLSGAEE